MHSKFTFWLKHLYYFTFDFNDKLFMLRIKKIPDVLLFRSTGTSETLRRNDPCPVKRNAHLYT